MIETETFAVVSVYTILYVFIIFAYVTWMHAFPFLVLHHPLKNSTKTGTPSLLFIFTPPAHTSSHGCESDIIQAGQ